MATPIGNLEDITLRALRILREAALVAAEDTRTARFLLNHYDIEVPVTSYYEHNALTKLDRIMTALETGDVAIISEAGMPGLADPGYRLITAAIEKGITVVPIPGPSAIPTALVVSGLPTDSFVYLGFLPRKTAARRQLLSQWKTERRTLVVFETPHRLQDSLADILAMLGDRPVAVARELTKLHEQVLRGKTSELLTHFQEEAPRGEIVLVIGGETEETRAEWSKDRIREALRVLLAEGLSKSQAARRVARQSNWTRSKVYDVAIELPHESAET